MAANNNLSDYLTSVADALRAKGGTTDPINAQDFPSVIANLPSGGGGTQDVESKDIDFYDYLGNRVASWTLAELATKTELPAAPQHDGMTFQSWNWTLEQLQQQSRPLDVGELCCTSDGVTRLYLEIPEQVPDDNTITLNISTSGEGISVNWGDGTSEDVGVGNVTLTHTYVTKGNKVVTISGDANIQLGYQSKSAIGNFVTKAELGARVKIIEASAFNGCTLLESINTPQGCDCARAAGSPFTSCEGLRVIIYDAGTRGGGDKLRKVRAFCFSPSQTDILPSGYSTATKLQFSSKVTGLANLTFPYNEAIRTITLPYVSSLPQQVLRGCTRLMYIEVPTTVTSIQAYAFYQCSSLKKLRFNNATPPTIAATTVFGSIPSTCVISVPTGTLEAYKAATNYPSNLTYIEED